MAVMSDHIEEFVSDQHRRYNDELPQAVSHMPSAATESGHSHFERPRTECNRRSRMATQHEDTREIAFYYPGHLWGNPEWIKSLLLFFDGIGLLVPEYKLHEPEIIDPVLAGPLRDKGRAVQRSL